MAEPRKAPWYFVVTRVVRGAFPSYITAAKWARIWIDRGYPAQIVLRREAYVAAPRPDKPFYAVVKDKRVLAIFDVESEARSIRPLGAKVVQTGLEVV